MLFCIYQTLICETLNQLCINRVDKSLPLVLPQRSHILWPGLVNANKTRQKQWWILQAGSDASRRRSIGLLKFAFQYNKKFRNSPISQTLPVGIPVCFHAIPTGLGHLFQTFHPHHLPAEWSVCRPKSPPVQRAQWSLFWIAKLSGLIAPIGPSIISVISWQRRVLGQTDSSSQACENWCVCRLPTRKCTNMDAHTPPSGPARVYQGVLFPAPRVLGEDFSCHTACSLGYFDVTNTEGAGMETLTLWIHI